MSVARKVRQGPENLPIASKTNLDWVVHGLILKADSPKTEFKHLIYHYSQNTDEERYQIVNNYFTVESLATSTNKIKLSATESRTRKYNEKNSENGRYEIGLLWKSDNIVLSESKSLAISKLHYMDRRTLKHDNFRKECWSKIQSYLRKKQCRKAHAVGICHVLL